VRGEERALTQRYLGAMSAVLVHGNPETAAVWGPLVDALAERGVTDVVRLSPPGFGAPVPDGFEATMDGYRDWLVAELERLDGPIDLVGHDWGGGHVGNALMERPELVRSWVSDVLGVFEPDYVWHDLAQAWQTPEVGEQHVAAMLGGTAGERAARFESLGITPGVASEMAAGLDGSTQACILRLYRDAAQPAVARRGEALDRLTARPGLALLATEDHYVGDDALRRRAAARAGARVEVLDGLGHWWMVEDPARGAAVLTSFWDGLDA
jgi:pimeloyl-ACP methyl ester carboxylesterase